jgi:6-phosphogluconolactonase
MAGVEPDVRVFKDPEALGEAAATIVAESANQAVSERGVFLLCLSGGKTPQLLYERLARAPMRDLIDWSHVQVFWGDERCVPAEDLRSNYRLAHELLLSHVPIPAENIHRVRTELDPELAADDYSLVLQMKAKAPLKWPRFDLVLLGLGEDGHTASLFPSLPIDPEAAVMTVDPKDPQRPNLRVTLTPAVFNSGRRVVFLVQGAGKSKVAASVLYGERQPDVLPAQLIQPGDGELIWMLDAGAAASM